MKRILSVSLIFFGLMSASQGFADSEFIEGFPRIDNQTFRKGFSLKGELFITDASGKKLLAPTTDMREWQAGVKSKEIEALWKTKAKGIRDVAVMIECQIHDDNSLTMNLRQYEKIEGHYGKNAKTGKLLNQQKIDIENFAPVSYVAETGSDYRVILRFTPSIDATREDMPLDKISIGGDGGTFIVTDNQGFLWGENVRLGGVYSGLSTHRGAVVFSFYPFNGGKEMGTAKGNKIELTLTDTLKLTIRNTEVLVPGDGRVKVYAKYIPKFKMDAPNSVYSFGQDKVENIPKEFGL